MGLQYLSSD